MLEVIAATPVSDIQLREPARVKPDTPLGEVVAIMHERRRGATIVEDGQGRIVGIFTERDLMIRVDHKDLAWQETPVAEVMTQDPIRIGGGESLSVALNRMREGNFRHLPVVDGDGKAAGIISVRDVLAHIAEYFPEEFINLPPDPEHEASHRWGG